MEPERPATPEGGRFDALAITVKPTDHGTVLVTVRVDGFRPVTIPIDPLHAIELGLQFHRAGMSAADAEASQVRNDRRLQQIERAKDVEPNG